MKRDRFTCSYCGAAGTDAELEIDHIVPVSRGGSNHMSNLTTACRPCNQSKGARAVAPSPQSRVPDVGQHPLRGRPFHSFNRDTGAVDWQGRVIDVVGDLAFLQLYSWLDGSEGRIATVTVSELASPCFEIYADHETMHDMYDRWYCEFWNGEDRPEPARTRAAARKEAIAKWRALA